MAKYKRKKSRKRRTLLLVLLAVLLSVFLFSTWYVIDYYTNSKAQASAYSDLAALVDAARDTLPTPTTAQDTPDPTGDAAGETPSAPVSTEPTEPGILPEYAQLAQMNPDMAGWIAIEGTPINYPVMLTPEEPNYYLRRNFNKEESTGGSIYVQEDCDLETPSDNVIIYGHNMRDRSMFGTLYDYRKQSYWEDHRYIRFDTLTQRHTYEIFAVFKTTVSIGQGFPYYQFVNAQDAADFDEFIAGCKSLSLYDTGLTPEYGDKIICLSTCEYSNTNGRFIIAAYRVE